MVVEPQIANDELVYAVRAWHADASLAVRIRRRRRLRPTAGLTGSYFERVQLEIDGRRLNVLLKQGGLPFGPQARESVFFAHLSPHLQVRAPRCFGVGQAAPGQDAWVLMERLPRGKRLVDWSEEETRQALRNLAALHAQYFDDPPLSVPQPFTRDLDETLSFVEGGAHALCERYVQFPRFPRIISDRALHLALE